MEFINEEPKNIFQPTGGPLYTKEGTPELDRDWRGKGHARLRVQTKES